MNPLTIEPRSGNEIRGEGNYLEENLFRAQLSGVRYELYASSYMQQNPQEH